MTIRDMSWYARASCHEVGNHYWFSTDPSKQNFAKFVCSLCPVQRECLRHALRTKSEFGIWGGLDKKERKALRQRLEDKRRLKYLFDEEESA